MTVWEETVVARPRVVVAAAGMLALGGALFAGEVLLSADRYFTIFGVYEAEAGGIAWSAFPVTIHLAMAAIGVLAGAALVAMAVPAFFGQSWARVVSWIFGLPILLWYGAVAALAAVGGLFGGDVPDTDPALSGRLEQAWPAWLDTLDTVLTVAVAALLIGALVAQTVPAADAYFRRRRRPVKLHDGW